MKIRELLKRVIPAYRVRDDMILKMNGLEREIIRVRQQIEDQNEKSEYLFWLLQKRENETLEQTKKRVFLDMPKAAGKLRDLQLAENYLLVRLKDICDQYNFRLCLAGGTLLGAVRHHGFIPWDDDIDVYMMREEALKLFGILKDDDQISIHYYYRKSGDHIIKLKYKFTDSVFIDIFTFDRIDCTRENKKARWEETQRAAHLYEAKMMEKIAACPNLPFKEKGIPTRLEQLDAFVEVEFDEVISQLEYYGHGNCLCESVFDGYFFRSPFGDGIFPENEMLPLIKDAVVFEGKTYDAFFNYQELLELQYKDIWRLPPAISSHHLYEVEEDLENAIQQIKERHYI